MAYLDSLDLAPLADLDDLRDRLKIEIPDAAESRASALLHDASAKVRNYTGRTISLVEDETERLRVRRGQLRLPQRPVISVTLVADVEGNELAPTWDGLDVLSFGQNALDWFERDITTWPPSVVDVTYTHGYETIPDAVIGVVCQIAGRAFGTPAEQSGVTSESIDAYSYSTGGAAAAGGFGLLADEKAVLDKFDRPGTSGRFG